MNTLTRILGVFMLLLIGIPLLVAMLWAAGISRAATSDRFYRDLSQKIVRRLPGLVETSFRAAQHPQAEEDPAWRAWVSAMTKTRTTLTEMLDQSGIQTWLEKQLAGTIERVGQVMRGQLAPAGISLDLQPLKQALTGPVFLEYLEQVLANLPACDPQGLEAWRQRALSGRLREPYPPCNPGVENRKQARSLINARVQEIPDRVPVFRQGQSLPAFDLTRLLSSFLWLFFLVPLLFVAIGAVLAGGAGRGFVRYSAGSILIAGLISLLLAGLAGGLFLSLILLDPAGFPTGGPNAWIWDTAAGRELAHQLGGMLGDFLQDLFSPVVTYSWIAVGAGLLLLILSMLGGRGSREPASLNG